MIDLHSHTKASDGELSPEDLIDMAMSRNITALAITDHDTVDSIDRAVKYAENKNITFVPGIEFSTDIKKGKMHILGLFIDYKHEDLKKKLEKIKIGRDNRNNEFIKKFNEMGFEITLEELKEISSGKIIAKPHFARIFIEKGYIKEKVEMFDKYFNVSPFKEIKRFSYTPKEVIEMIKEVNGIAILAHPQTLKLEGQDFVEKIKELKGYGLDGMECYHSKQTPEQMKLFREIAESEGLLITKGSDYHGPIVKPEVELGTGKNDNIVINDEEELFKKVQNYLKNKLNSV